MAKYYWTRVHTSQWLEHYSSSFNSPLLDMAKELLAKGLPFEVGEMWYGGKFQYRLRYTARVDYALNCGTEDLYINSDARGHWVMDSLGSIHSVPFTTIEHARAYMEHRSKQA